MEERLSTGSDPGKCASAGSDPGYSQQPSVTKRSWFMVMPKAALWKNVTECMTHETEQGGRGWRERESPLLGFRFCCRNVMSSSSPAPAGTAIPLIHIFSPLASASKLPGSKLGKDTYRAALGILGSCVLPSRASVYFSIV